MGKKLLLIFTRNPELGKVKTRLAADIGQQAALNLYQLLVKHTHKVTRELTVDKMVCYSEEIPAEDLWETSEFKKALQKGNNLGERMQNAFKEGFKAGYSEIVIIGSDLYDLQKEDLEKAFLELEHHDYVIGPAQDGGYYLIGKKSLHSKVFKNKSWSTSSVLQDTLKDLENENVKILEERNDIDTLEDLKAYPELLQYLKNT